MEVLTQRMGIPSRRLGQLNVSREFSSATRRLELPAQQFIYQQGVTGILLLMAALLAVAWANSPWADFYFRLWNAEISFDLGIVHFHKSLHHWINDGLMTFFFFLVGMEIKGELIHGYLSSRKKAALPVIAALGGMIVPAALYLVINSGTSTVHGWGIPMATDIAFAVGILALVPCISHELKVFLLALAIVDDIGAILVIAIFYSESVHLAPLLVGACVLVAIYGLQNARVTFAFPYVFLGVLFWVAISRSGIHATIAGVILAFIVTTRPAISKSTFEERAVANMELFHSARANGNESEAEAALGAIEALAHSTDPPVERLTRATHPWVGFVILPLFAFANSGVTLSFGQLRQAMAMPVLWGIIVGLVVGKPFGIVLFSWISSKIGLAEIPTGTSILKLTGIGVLAGVGFTVAIFVTALAFQTETTINAAKTAILLASILAGVFGFVILRFADGRRQSED